MAKSNSGTILAVLLLAGCAGPGPVERTVDGPRAETTGGETSVVHSPVPRDDIPEEVEETPVPAPPPPPESADPFAPPEGWQPEPASGMRKFQFRLPRSDGDGEDGSVVVFHFGVGGGGGVDANIERWRGQFTGVEHGVDTVETIDGADADRMTVLDIAGRYVAETRPGSGERVDHPDWRMIAAVVEIEGGPFFVKAMGPNLTMGKWERSIRAYLRGILETR